MKDKVFSPKNLKDALRILKSDKERISLLAGGTTLLLNKIDNATYLNIEGLNLNYIKNDRKYLKIGAMTTLGELVDSSKIKNLFNGLIRNCILSIVSTPIRNLITVGGNIVGIHPWSAIPGLLLILDGEIITATGKIFPSAKFFLSSPKALLGKDIITEIKIPLSRKNVCARWLKFSLTETDYPILSVGGVYQLKNNRVEHIRLSAIGLTILPQRFYKAEKILLNKELDRTNINSAIRSIKEEAKISNDIRVSIDYKREILGTLMKDILIK